MKELIPCAPRPVRKEVPMSITHTTHPLRFHKGTIAGKYCGHFGKNENYDLWIESRELQVGVLWNKPGITQHLS